HTEAAVRSEAAREGAALLRAAVGRHGVERVVDELAPFWALQLDASAEDAAAAVREMVSGALAQEEGSVDREAPRVEEAGA
ncbi:MAG TPA: hypothetical protein VEX11_15200, partial [Acetobacteraceae bacterium]|nr:hypothetical protein [Acetobacteraceae bacterium]